MKRATSHVPAGYHTLTPTLTIRDCAKAIDFYARAFGATEHMRLAGPGGKVLHAELDLEGSRLMVHDEAPEAGVRSPQTLGGTSSGVFVYVKDVDAVLARAAGAGAKVTMPCSDMFWGDRMAKVTDPFGHEWILATHKYEPTEEEVAAGQRAFMAQMMDEG
jgi:PhnB protein